MRRMSVFLCISVLFLVPVHGDDLDPKEIIARFAQKESEFRELWQQYTYLQKVDFEVLNELGRVRERQTMEIEVYFTTEGKRETRVLSNRGELRSVRVTREDISDAVGVQPFVLTSEELPEYNIKYKGKETVDELDTYVFEVKPRKIRDGRRYFRGKIWVDSIDHQIVMTQGKAVPDYRDNKFPEFETRREQIDGYWFPTWTKADDYLTFGDFYNQRHVRVRQLITYENFRKFEVGTSIKYGPVQGQPEDTPAETPEE
jgi:outer membrane lipoprotein-sorting protein